jgi:hypothetical protein
MSSGVPFFMNWLYVSPCCNIYWQGVMILQGKDKSVVNMQLSVHHVRLKHSQEIGPHTATVCCRNPKHDTSNLHFLQIFQDYGLPWHDAVYFVGYISSLRSKLLPPYSRFYSKQQVSRYIGVSTKLQGVIRETTVVQRSVCLASRSWSPNDGVAKCEVPILTLGFKTKINPLQNKGDRLNQNLQRTPFILSLIAAALSDRKLHPPVYPVKDTKEHPVYEVLIFHQWYYIWSCGRT